MGRLVLVPRQIYNHVAIVSFQETHGMMTGAKFGKTGFCAVLQEGENLTTSQGIESGKLYILDRTVKNKVKLVAELRSDRESDWILDAIETLKKVASSA